MMNLNGISLWDIKLKLLDIPTYEMLEQSEYSWREFLYNYTAKLTIFGSLVIQMCYKENETEKNQVLLKVAQLLFDELTSKGFNEEVYNKVCNILIVECIQKLSFDLDASTLKKTRFYDETKSRGFFLEMYLNSWFFIIPFGAVNQLTIEAYYESLDSQINLHGYQSWCVFSDLRHWDISPYEVIKHVANRQESMINKGRTQSVLLTLEAPIDRFIAEQLGVTTLLETSFEKAFDFVLETFEQERVVDIKVVGNFIDAFDFIFS